MDKQEINERVEGVTLEWLLKAAAETEDKLRKYPKWESMANDTRRVLYFYEAFCAGAEGGAEAREGRYRRAWHDGYKWALADIKAAFDAAAEAKAAGRDAAEIVAQLRDNPAPITLPDWV